MPRQSPEQNGQFLVQDAVVMDIPSTSKFGFTWASEQISNSTPSGSDHTGPISDSDDSDTELTRSPEHAAAHDLKESTDELERSPTTSTQSSRARQPRMSRAFTMPLPAQLGHLQNPHRPPLPAPAPALPLPSSDVAPFRELSLELADSVQMVIQTMLQISPAQILDPAKEQFSACSLAVPTPSMSAILTAMKNLNYISANMAAFCEPKTAASASLTNPASLARNIPNDFDVGEMLQSVGDALSGAAAHAGVDLVLYHGDTGMQHVNVRGDENGVAYALSHIVRQVISTAHRGDAIELGLFIESASPRLDSADNQSDEASSSESCVCTFDISHKFGDSDPRVEQNGVSDDSERESPVFTTLLLRRLLAQIGGSLDCDLPPKTFPVGRACELKLILERGSESADNLQRSRESLNDTPGSIEPTLPELAEFSESLKGKKVTLCASSNGSFAHHLTSYLMSWGMDISHVPSEAETEGFEEGFPPPSPQEDRRPSGAPQPLSFVFIDDDVTVLKQRLNALRVTQPYQLNLNLRKRPSLAANHRPRSSPRISTRNVSQVANPSMSSSVVIVHFTSLANFRVVKDMIQTEINSYTNSRAPVPEIMILPKPAGPRRILTALHTAVTKPVIDPFFSPTATSPSTSVQSQPYFQLHTNSSRSSIHNHRPSGSRTNSDTSKDFLESSHAYPLPSPLGMSDNVEYFSEQPTVKLGTSPSSGLVIQSPDGQPAGIVFHPRPKTSKQTPTSLTMERDKGQLFVPTASRRVSDSEMSVKAQSFASLHTAAGPSGSPQIPAAVVADLTADNTDETTPKPRPSPRVDVGNTGSNFNHGNGYPSSLQQVAMINRRSSPSDLRRMGSPPGSPHGDNVVVPRRSSNRRMTQTQGPAVLTPSGGKGKVAGDANIVPPINVLVVDDNAINQKVVCAYMKKINIKYDTASNGLEAVDKWKTGGFHLILMDIQMPIMDGIQATKEIRRLEKINANAGFPPATPSSEGTRTPDSSSEPRPSPYRSSVIIVALTASSLQSDRVAALAAGCNDFLTKPVSHQWLNSKIVEWGSIKALQMYANIKIEPPGQAAQARSIAERLYVPKGRTTPSPVRTGETPVNPAATTTAPPAATVHLNPPTSTTSSAFWSPDQHSPATFWGGPSVSSPTATNFSALTTNNRLPSPPASDDSQVRESVETAPSSISSSALPSPIDSSFPDPKPPAPEEDELANPESALPDKPAVELAGSADGATEDLPAPTPQATPAVANND